MGRRAAGGLHANAEPSEQLCAPAAGAEAESSGERLAGLSLPGLWRLRQGPGAAAPGQKGGERAGLSHPARRPGRGLRKPPRGRRPTPAPHRTSLPCRPPRTTAPGPRNSQLQLLVGRGRHPAPQPPSSVSDRAAPRLRRYRSPSFSGRRSQPLLTAPPRQAEGEDGARRWTNLVRAH